MVPTRPINPVVLAAALVVVGCGGEVPIYATPETMQLGQEAAKAATWSPTAEQPVTLALDVPRAARAGALVQIRIVLRNPSPFPVATGIRRRRGVDILVARSGMPSDSGAVWSLPKEDISGDVVLTDPLRPGRDTTFDATWPGTDDNGRPVPPGQYEVRARLTSLLLPARALWTDWRPIEIK